MLYHAKDFAQPILRFRTSVLVLHGELQDIGSRTVINRDVSSSSQWNVAMNPPVQRLQLRRRLLI